MKTEYWLIAVASIVLSVIWITSQTPQQTETQTDEYMTADNPTTTVPPFETDTTIEQRNPDGSRNYNAEASGLDNMQNDTTTNKSSLRPIMLDGTQLGIVDTSKLSDSDKKLIAQFYTGNLS